MRFLQREDILFDIREFSLRGGKTFSAAEDEYRRCHYTLHFIYDGSTLLPFTVIFT